MDNKEIHSNLLEILKTVDRICKKESITYMLTQGNLLGAIREKGFIEWDIEDADIMMHRKDFNAFTQYCRMHPEELNFVFSRDDNACGLVHRLKFKQNHEIFVEIILIDLLPKNMIKRNIKLLVLILIRGMLCLEPNKSKNTKTIASKIKLLAMYCLRSVGRLFNREKLQHFYENISQYGSDGNCDSIFFSNDENVKKMTSKFDKTLLDETIRVPYEDTELTVPKEWNRILKFYYGDGYMKPKRESYKV